MKFIIDKKLFERFPDVVIGVISAKQINNAETDDEIQRLLRVIEKEIRAKYDTETLSQNPKIDCWRKAYSSFGAKPKENKSSVENLYRTVLQGNDIRHINKLVDIYNFISLKHMVPAGGEDVDKMKGDIMLTFAGKDEPSVLLLGDKDARQPHEGEVIYKDEVSAICRRWNWREADRTKFTETTRNCVLVIEGLSPVTKKDVEIAVVELKELVQKYCGGEIMFNILDKDKNEEHLYS